MLQECFCQERFRVDWLSVLKNTSAGLKYVDFYPHPCILALTITVMMKLTLPMQNFFMTLSELSPR